MLALFDSPEDAMCEMGRGVRPHRDQAVIPDPPLDSEALPFGGEQSAP
jgi:hypothetical protein